MVCAVICLDPFVEQQARRRRDEQQYGGDHEARVVVQLQLKRAFLGPVQDEVLLV